MEFFKKIKWKLSLEAGFPLTFALTCFIFVFGGFTVSSVFKGNLPDVSVLILFIASILARVLIIYFNLNRDEYIALMRNAKLLGDPNEIGQSIADMKDSIHIKAYTTFGKRCLRFNEKLIFYSDFQTVKLVIPSKITEISASSHFYKGMHYTVEILYQYEQHISIETHSQKDAEILCNELKEISAPHLLKDAE